MSLAKYNKQKQICKDMGIKVKILEILANSDKKALSIKDIIQISLSLHGDLSIFGEIVHGFVFGVA